MIFVQGQSIGVPEFQGTNAEGEIARMAFANYGHLLRGNGNAETKRFTFAEFADLVAEHYDTTTAQNAEVVRVLRSLHQRNPWEHPEAPRGQMLYVATRAPADGRDAEVVVFVDEVAAGQFAADGQDYAVSPVEVKTLGVVRFDAPLSVGHDCFLAVCIETGEVEAEVFWAETMRNEFVANHPRFVAVDEVVHDRDSALAARVGRPAPVLRG